MKVFGLNKCGLVVFLLVFFINQLAAQTKNIEKLVKKDSAKYQPNVVELKLEEVIITAQKREEFLQKAPLSVSIFNKKEIEQFGFRKINEISGLVPNLYSAEPGDERNVTSLRGISTTSYDPTVATYIDGVNQFNLDTYIPVLFDVERIEVLRGPQGTLYGRNAMGGVINIITKQPTNETGGFAELSLGNYNQSRVAFGVRTPFVKNKLFAGASILYQGRDGYYSNDFNNTSYDQQKSFSANYFLKYMMNSKWQMSLNWKHYSGNSEGPFPLAAGVEEGLANPYKLNQNAITTMRDQTMNASLAIQYKGSKLQFSSISSFQKNYRYYTQPIDGDFSPLDAISIQNNYGKSWNNIKAYTQEFKINSPSNPSNKLVWLAGAYLFYQEAPVKQATRFGADANLLMIGDSLFTLLSTTQSNKIGMALYGQISYAIKDNFRVTLGWRNDMEKQKQSVAGYYQHDPMPDYYESYPDTSASISFNAFSPKLSIDYTAKSGAVFYASYNKGYRTGGLSPLSSDPSQPPLMGYNPEFSDNIELGYKQRFLNNRIYMNLVAYYTKVSNAQVPTLILPDAITVTKNTGALSSKGIEAEITTIPFKGLNIQYILGLTDASYTSLNLSQQSGAIDLSGKRPLFTPSYNSALTIQYTYAFPKKNISAYVRSTMKNMGNTYFDLKNTIQQNPYTLVNASMGLNVNKISFEIWSKNCFNQNYIAYAFDFGAIHLGNPALFGVTLTTKF